MTSNVSGSKPRIKRRYDNARQQKTRQGKRREDTTRQGKARDPFHAMYGSAVHVSPHGFRAISGLLGRFALQSKTRQSQETKTTITRHDHITKQRKFIR